MNSNEVALNIRAQALRMTNKAHSSHIGSCLSIADILSVLYVDVLRLDPNDRFWPERDRFILSKGHAAAILFAVLAEKGFISHELLDSFCEDGSVLGGHVSSLVPGVEISTGSLGHGLPIGIGMALAAKHDGRQSRTFVLMSDGELDEGSNWEAFLSASHNRLENLVAIIDSNKIQSFGRVNDVISLDPLRGKLENFNWDVMEIDGHNHDEIRSALSSVPRQKGRPTVIIANTIKGKGVSFMEDQLKWHYKSPNDKELEEAMRELGVEK